MLASLVLVGCVTTVEKSYFKLLGPGKLYPDFFERVQMSKLFKDSKTFVDSVPRRLANEINADYRVKSQSPTFDLRQFLSDNFIVPSDNSIPYRSDSSQNIASHIQKLWPVLTRGPDQHNGGTLIPLPNEYVVPGGRFREVYYWDSFFTMLGLLKSEEHQLILDMIDNFAYLINRVGFIPNGNRTYYLGRSQPPFFSLMVTLSTRSSGDHQLVKYLDELQKEYDFWMNGEENLTVNSPSHDRVVLLSDGSVLNRYWDKFDTPRPESYIEDVEVVTHHAIAGSIPGSQGDSRPS